MPKLISPAALLHIKQALLMQKPIAITKNCRNPYPSFKLSEKTKMPDSSFFTPFNEICFFINTPIPIKALEIIVLASICKPNKVSVCINRGNESHDFKSSLFSLNQLEVPIVIAPPDRGVFLEIAEIWLKDKRIKTQIYPLADYLSYYMSKIIGSTSLPVSASDSSLPSLLAMSLYNNLTNYKEAALDYFLKNLSPEIIGIALKHNFAMPKFDLSLQITITAKELESVSTEKWFSCSEMTIHCSGIAEVFEIEDKIKELSKKTSITISVPCTNTENVLHLCNTFRMPIILRGIEKDIYKKVLIEVFEAWAYNDGANYSIYPLASIIGNAARSVFLGSKKNSLKCPESSLYGGIFKSVYKDVINYAKKSIEKNNICKEFLQ
jgi:hypothetical protein